MGLRNSRCADGCWVSHEGEHSPPFSFSTPYLAEMLISTNLVSGIATSFILGASSTFALPTTSSIIPTASGTVPYNVNAPQVSPTFVAPPSPNIMSVEALAGLFNSVPPTPVEETLTARDVAERMLLGDPVFDGALLRRAEEAEFSPRRKRAPKSSKVVAAPASKVAPAQFDVGQAQRAIAANCVGSLANDTYISSVSPPFDALLPSVFLTAFNLVALLLRRRGNHRL